MIKVNTAGNTDFSTFKTGLAFRPFFWLGAVFGCVSLAVWWFFWQGSVVLQPEGGLIWWHQHEMLFGFVVAIVVGFLLTAVQTWTGIPSLTGMRLWAVVLLWLLGRILLAHPMGLSAVTLLVIDVVFLPVVALCMASFVIQTKKWNNLVFAPLLLLMMGANIAMHWGKMIADPEMVRQGAYLAIWLVVCLILIIGGRVIPFFTSRALGVQLSSTSKLREQLIMISALILCLFQSGRVLSINVSAWLFVIPIIALFLLNIGRLRSWETHRCWHQPLLWGLHIGYAFVVLGLLLWAFSEFNVVTVDIAVHTLTIGAILGMVLAMMARVSLGHTGRVIAAKPGLGLVLSCIFIAGLIRGALLIIWPAGALWAYSSSLILCLIAFIWFVALYTVPLWVKRVDNKPG